MGESSRRPWLRPLAVRLHRWIALTVGAWFALLGLTGSLLVWHEDLDGALNPQWFAPRASCDVDIVASQAPVAAALGVFAETWPSARPTMVMAPREPGAAYSVWEQPGPDTPRRQHFVDAACGEYLGWREWGVVEFDRAHVVSAIYELHRSLLSGEAGHVAVGVVGLSMSVALGFGLAAAWPRIASREAWRRVLTIKRHAAPARRWYDLHRAGGIWLLPVLLLLCLSGAYLCFPAQSRAIVGGLMPTLPPMRADAIDGPVGEVAPDDVVARAQHRWPEARWSRLTLPSAASPVYEVRLLQPDEPRKDTGDTRVRFDAAGRLLEVRDPLRAPAGEVLVAWLFPLHSGEALGLAGRLAWTVLGLSPAILFATGLWLWLHRRRARRERPSRLSAASASPAARSGR